ncbi:MAG: GNAT family N-acetyltransferase [Desulfobacterales bacterium]|nr:GNAT family N-acetyltransferase [Desulfobacterales bacterium]
MVKSLEYLAKPFYENRCYRIYRIDLTDWAPTQNKASNFDFKLITPTDQSIIEKIENLEEWLVNRVKDKMNKGHICMAVLDNNKVAGFNIIALDKVEIPLLRQVRHLKEDEAWSDQITIAKEYRRIGLGTKLRYEIFGELKKRNIKKLFGGTLINNTASLGLAKQAGFQEVADIHFIKLFGIKRWKEYEVKE